MFCATATVLVSAAWALAPATVPPRYLPTPAPYELPEGYLDFDCPESGCAVGDDDDEDDARMEAFVRGVYFDDKAVDDVEGVGEDFVFDVARVLESEEEEKERLLLAKIGSLPSHELVETDEQQRPLFARDFAFVDEAKCNGCGLCSQIAAATFMAEPQRGRGRAYHQNGDAASAIDEAIHACPRQAIHRVSFDQLKRLEQRQGQLHNPALRTKEDFSALLSSDGREDHSSPDDDAAFLARLRLEQARFYKPREAFVDL